MPRKGENIRQRKDGRWEGRYLAWDPGKCRKASKSVYAKTYTEAKEKLTAAKTAAHMQQPDTASRSSKEKEIPAENIDLAGIASEWIASVRENKKHSTYVKYSQIYENHLKPIFSGIMTHNLSIGDMAERMSSIDLSSWSLTASVYSVANSILQFAHEKYGTPYSRISPKRSCRKARPIEIFTLAEQRRLLRELYQGLLLF